MRTAQYYNEKKKTLKDRAIIQDLLIASEMYKNGEISEVRDMLVDIVNSIDTWEMDL